MHRSFALLSAFAVAFLLVSFTGNKISHAAPDEVTGCLSSKGKLSKFALGDSPAKPCNGGDTQVSFGGEEGPEGPEGPEGKEGPEGPPGVGGLVIVDFNGDEMPAVILGLSDGIGLHALVDVSELAGFDARFIANINSRFGIRAPSATGLWFDGFGCLGQPYVEDTGVAGVWAEPVYVTGLHITPGSEDDFELWMGDPTTPTTALSGEVSREPVGFTEGCQNIDLGSSTKDVVEAELISADLELETGFVPPYTVEQR